MDAVPPLIRHAAFAPLQVSTRPLLIHLQGRRLLPRTPQLADVTVRHPISSTDWHIVQRTHALGGWSLALSFLHNRQITLMHSLGAVQKTSVGV